MNYTKRIRQRNGDTSQVELRCGLRCVGVGIVEDVAGNATHRLKANGRGHCRGASRNGDGLWCVGGGEDGVGWGCHRDTRNSHRNASEGVVAGTVSCGGTNHTEGIGKGNNDTTHIELFRTLGSVAIDIRENMSAYGTLCLEANRRGNRCTACDHGNGLWIIGCGGDGVGWVSDVERS